MIILDTNVLSEPLRTRPDARVLDWLEANLDVGLTVVTAGELLTGAHSLPGGKRRDGILRAIEELLGRYADRIMPYDQWAARAYATMRATRRAVGSPLSVEDGMVAATCSSMGAPLATRNTKDFVGLDIELVNPWLD